jgi:hypothetical protein
MYESFHAVHLAGSSYMAGGRNVDAFVGFKRNTPLTGDAGGMHYIPASGNGPVHILRLVYPSNAYFTIFFREMFYRRPLPH